MIAKLLKMKLVVMKTIKDDSRPTWTEISGECQALKSLWGQWKRSEVVDGVLQRLCGDDLSDMTKLQIIVPSKR